MILGHNFDSEDSYACSLDIGHELHSPTWRNLQKLLVEAKIDLENCFFTNFYMGLIAGSRSTGRFPGATDEGFVNRCIQFLKLQIQVQQPSAILTLGKWVPSLLAKVSPDLIAWTGKKDFGSIDAVGPVKLDCTFDALNHNFNVAALTHPCLRDSNVGRRRYKRWTGHRAELEMIKAVSCNS